jgi:nuclear GTP-binding protein
LWQQKKVHLLDTESFEDTFGPKKKRRRSKLAVEDFAALVEKVEKVRGMSNASSVPSETFLL